MKKREHVHKYEYRNLSSKKGIKAYFCALVGCNHHMPPHYEPLYLNSLCWSCGSTFTIDTDKNKAMHPICDECRDSPNLKGHVEMVQAAREIFGPEPDEKDLELEELIKDKPAKVEDPNKRKFEDVVGYHPKDAQTIEAMLAKYSKKGTK